MTTRNFIIGQWRVMRWIWIACLVVALIVVITDFVDAISKDDPLPWIAIAAAIGFTLWGTGIMWLARRWFNFMLGSEVCTWRGTR